MHWYTLIPFDALTFQNTSPSTPSGPWESGDRFPPSGRTLVAGLQDLLQESAIISLSGPFLCHSNTLYFPCPLSHRSSERLIPATWLPEQTNATGEPDWSQQVLWDRRKPAPLLGKLDTPTSPWLKQERHFLSYEMLLKLLKTPPAQEDWQCVMGHPQPWTVETRSHSTFVEDTYPLMKKGAFTKRTIRLDQGWKLAIALDQETHKKLQRLGEVFLVRLGEEGHHFWLEAHHEPAMANSTRTISKKSQNCSAGMGSKV
jgi:CRISPR-associated protein Cmr3